MKKLFYILLLALVATSCNVTESIVFNENGSGTYIMTYKMGDAMKAMTEAMGGNQNQNEKNEQGEIMDTTMVFADIMETYKDSIAALPPEKRAAINAVKDMFVNMKVNEDEGVMNFGIGMEFSDIYELSNIQDKIEKVKSLDDKNDQINKVTDNSPLGALTSAEDAKTSYLITDNTFTRTTEMMISEEEMENMETMFESSTEENQQFMEYFEESVFKVKYTFPKAVKSVSVKGAEISDDRKTVTYEVNWVEYLKNPLMLDMNVTFVDE